MARIKLPSHLATLRMKAGLKQTQVAFALDVSDKKVSRWELGLNVPNSEEIKQLARLYGTDPNEVTGWATSSDMQAV